MKRSTRGYTAPRLSCTQTSSQEVKPKAKIVPIILYSGAAILSFISQARAHIAYINGPGSPTSLLLGGNITVSIDEHHPPPRLNFVGMPGIVQFDDGRNPDGTPIVSEQVEFTKPAGLNLLLVTLRSDGETDFFRSPLSIGDEETGENAADAAGKEVTEIQATGFANGRFLGTVTYVVTSDDPDVPEGEPVPEPGSLALLSAALFGFGFLGRKRRGLRGHLAV